MKQIIGVTDETRKKIPLKRYKLQVDRELSSNNQSNIV